MGVTPQVPYMGKEKQLLELVKNSDVLQECADIFNKINATANEVQQAGEKVFLSMYGAKDDNTSLDEYRYAIFQKSLKKKVAKLEALPPTSASALQHSLRAYHQIQQWRGNRLKPEDWGWQRDGKDLQPVRTLLPPAPDAIMSLISCSCKGTCSTSHCSCFKTGIACSAICKVCEGESCMNTNLNKICKD